MSQHTLWEFASDPERANVFRIRRANRDGWEAEDRSSSVKTVAPFVLPTGWRRTTSRRGLPRLSQAEAAQLGWQLWGALPSELKADRGWIEIAVGTERLIDMPWECLRADGVPL